MSEQVVICEPVRTPIGRYSGTLKALTAAELGEIALRGLLDRRCGSGLQSVLPAAMQVSSGASRPAKRAGRMTPPPSARSHRPNGPAISGSVPSSASWRGRSPGSLPRRWGIGPVPASLAALERAGLKLRKTRGSAGP